MSFIKYLVTILFIFTYAYCNGVTSKSDGHSTTAIKQTTKNERVDVHIYYDTHCPFCIDFFTNHVEPILPIMHKYLRVHLYPYGTAGTYTRNGKFVTWCQHGEPECHGNKLHACALDILKNETQATFYVTCMMTDVTDDSAAIKCGKTMNIEAAPIIECANSYKAELLLKHYRDLSIQAHYSSVPYITVNGKSSSQRDFESNICNAFKNPPLPCHF